jgi:hypothetical protein
MSLERLIEDKIREAQAEGAFDNLPGHGKPFAKVDDELAGDDWMALHLLRANGFLPHWLELRKEIAGERPAVAAAFNDWREAIGRHGSRFHATSMRAGERYRRAAEAINLKIDQHNLRCPSIHLELVRFREDAEPSAG